MKMKLEAIIVVLIFAFVACKNNSNVSYEYGKKRPDGKLFYEDYLDTVICNKDVFLKINQKLSHDTCYSFNDEDSLLSTSISLSGYLDPDYLYVRIQRINRVCDSSGVLELVVEEDKIKRDLRFSNDLVIGPFPNFKVRKEDSYFKLFYKEFEYKINIDSDYAFLLLSIDDNYHLKCSYRNDLPLMR